MAYRTVRDTDGVEWEVWEVKPVWAERRAGDRRSPNATAGPPGAERRMNGDRREGYDPSRPRISPGLECGWLAFACDQERRRLAPAPMGWENLSDDALIRLCRAAPPYAKREPRSLG